MNEEPTDAPPASRRGSRQPCPSCGDTGWKPQKKTPGEDVPAALCTCTHYVYARADAGSIYENPRPLLLRPGRVYTKDRIDPAFALRLLEDRVIRPALADGSRCPACAAAAAASTG